MDHSPHGQRSTYQHGCRCTPCKAAEASYRRDLRLRHAKGQPILGRLVSAVEARRRIRQLKLEGYPDERVLAMAGWHDGRRRHLLIPPGALIRVDTLVRIRIVADLAMLEGTASAASL